MGAKVSTANGDAIGTSLREDPDLTVSRFPDSVGLTATLSNPRDPRGRTLGYAEYGSNAATSRHVMLFFHGTPGTRFFFSKIHSEYASQHGVYVIIPERPGYGLSPPVKQRTILDGAREAAALLEILKIRQKVHVVGYSAGGPFALAFAHDFPNWCATVTVVSSLSPRTRGVTNGMSLRDKAGYVTACYTPGVVSFILKASVPSERRCIYDHYREDWPEEDNDFFSKREDVRRLFARSTLELYSRRHGVIAEATDYVLLTRNWGFSLENIGGDFNIWVYGGAVDCKCTPAMFETLVRLLPSDRTRQFQAEGSGHLYFYKLFEERLFTDLGIVVGHDHVAIEKQTYKQSSSEEANAETVSGANSTG